MPCGDQSWPRAEPGCPGPLVSQTPAALGRLPRRAGLRPRGPAQRLAAVDAGRVFPDSPGSEGPRGGQRPCTSITHILSGRSCQRLGRGRMGVPQQVPRDPHTQVILCHSGLWAGDWRGGEGVPLERPCFLRSGQQFGKEGLLTPSRARARRAPRRQDLAASPPSSLRFLFS